MKTCGLNSNIKQLNSSSYLAWMECFWRMDHTVSSQIWLSKSIKEVGRIMPTLCLVSKQSQLPFHAPYTANPPWHPTVDQPVGTGFSFANTDSYMRNMTEVAVSFNTFLDMFFEVFPERATNEVSRKWLGIGHWRLGNANDMKSALFSRGEFCWHLYTIYCTTITAAKQSCWHNKGEFFQEAVYTLFSFLR